MVKIMIAVAGSILTVGAMVAAICCLRAGALYDQWLLLHPPNMRRKEEAVYEEDSDIEYAELFTG